MIGVEFLVLTFFAAMALIGIGYLSREGEIETLKDEIEVLKRDRSNHLRIVQLHAGQRVLPYRCTNRNTITRGADTHD